MRRPSRLVSVAAVAATVLSGVTAVELTRAPVAAAATETYTLPQGGSVQVLGRGNGHGHGMSQYGAQGAASKGLSAKQILDFYYPGTKTAGMSSVYLRVGLSNGSKGTEVTYEKGMTIVDASGKKLADIPAGYTQLHMVKDPDGSGLVVSGRAGSTDGWHGVARSVNLSTAAAFKTTDGTVTLVRNGGGTAQYRGTLGVSRSGSSLVTVNRLTLDQYTQGVVPSEMPTSWKPAAVQAQAVAARTYAYYEMQHPYSPGRYDICDTQSCQVYGGLSAETSGGNAAVTATAGQVRTYNGAPAFTQFTSANGGWMAAGGQKYLVSKADPYDPATQWSVTLSTASIAADLGLAKASKLVVTSRDGNGAWGGRINSFYVDGYDAAGRSKRVTVTGQDNVRWAFGLKDSWFTITSTKPGAPRSVKASCTDAGATLSWAVPSSTGVAAISSYTVSWGGGSKKVSGSARSLYVGPLTNGTKVTFTVRATNKSGTGPSVSASCTPAASPGGVTVLSPSVVFDSRPKAKITPTHPATFYAEAGKGGYPNGAKSAQISVSIVSPTANGYLRVYTSGKSTPAATVGIHYHKGMTSAALVTLPLSPTAKLVLRPTAGSMDLVGTRVSYASAKGGSLVVRPAKTVGTFKKLPKAGKSVLFKGLPGVTKSTKAVLVGVTLVSRGKGGTIRLLPNGLKDRKAYHLNVKAGATANTVVLMTLSSARRLRIYGNSKDLVVQLQLLGTVGKLTATGRLESVPVTPLYGTASGRPAVPVAKKLKAVQIAGIGQVPATGVKAVLAIVTSARNAKAGNVQVRAAKSGAAFKRIVSVTTSRVTVGTALLPLGKNGKVDVRTDGTSTTLTIQVIGYITG